MRAVKKLSIYEEALSLARQTHAEDLGRVANLSRRDFDERETFLFKAQPACIEYLCLLIENALLLRPSRAGRIYAGFGKLSRLEPVIARYLRIADLSERLYVFGEPDWQPPRHPNMRLITLKDNYKLAREWFIIADSPMLRAALVALEEDEAVAQEARSIRALKTSSPAIVTQLAMTAEDLIDSALTV